MDFINGQIFLMQQPTVDINQQTLQNVITELCKHIYWINRSGTRLGAAYFIPKQYWEFVNALRERHGEFEYELAGIVTRNPLVIVSAKIKAEETETGHEFEITTELSESCQGILTIRSTNDTDSISSSCSRTRGGQRSRPGTDQPCGSTGPGVIGHGWPETTNNNDPYTDRRWLDTPSGHIMPQNVTTN